MSAAERKVRRKPVPPRQSSVYDVQNLHETPVHPLLGDREGHPEEVIAHPEIVSTHGMTAADGGSTATSEDGLGFVGKTPPGSREGTQSHPGGLASRILKGWWQELACCAISIVSFVALVFFLRAFNGEPLPSWPSGITINTVVAFLATISRTAFVIPVAEGLSQAKWNWFKKKPRPLEDFDAFDQASRGPWGSLTLLLRTKGWLVGIFSAVLFVTSIATSTLTQSVVSYPSRNVSIAEEGRARAWKIDHYYQWSTNPIAEARRMEPVTMAIAQAMYTPVAANLSLREPECFATNCTWPRFSTLAMCYNMTDVSELIKSDSAKFNYGTKLTLPNGVNTTISGDYKTVALSHEPSLVYNDTRYHDASVFNYFAIQADLLDEHPRATEVVFHWCIDTYDASVVNNVVSFERVLSHTEAHYGPSKELRFGTTANVTYLTSPADGGGATKHTAEGMNRTETIRMLQSVMSGTTTYSQRNQFKNGSDVLMHAYISTLKPYEDRYQKENLSDAEKLTDKRNACLLPGISNVNGTAWQREVYVEIRWQWLALLAMQVVLSVLLLALIIMETVGADVDVVKSSMLAALFAISAEEKTALEKDITEGKPLLLDGQGDHQLVVPTGIAGELRKEAGGKWVLGGSNCFFPLPGPPPTQHWKRPTYLIQDSYGASAATNFVTLLYLLSKKG
ncbi:hypothetical protein CMUS01_16104 [Colletotrichum musicola]|uniref:Uncharacterized protein n=1 Tax=Colletotrichum musicola TaxID=2175873 RepID=A0A8H6MKH6_9PEZI|nr:hypothetical protein CMUS01_16104 [Colletotrichum musicola]